MAISTQAHVVSAFGAASTAAEVAAGHDLAGRRVIVTGGASGIGVETARVLAGIGANVTIAARNVDQARFVARTIADTEKGARVRVEALDLASLASVRAFAARWGDKPLHLLINNAGVMACPLAYTEDGFETQLGVNHLGHFLLARLLTPALSNGAPARVVSLSSAAHKLGSIDWDDPHFKSGRTYHPFTAYGQAKTANALFAVGYDARLRADGVRAHSVMPGVIATPLMRHMTPALRAEMSVKPSNPERPPQDRSPVKSVEQGAATTVWAAIAPQLDNLGGLYLEDCGVSPISSPESRGGRGVLARAIDVAEADRLWAFSDAAVGL